VLEWRLIPQGGGQETMTTADADAAVRFNFRVVSGANPLSLSGLRRLSLPEKITSRGN